jgi:hypothetical protein
MHDTRIILPTPPTQPMASPMHTEYPHKKVRAQVQHPSWYEKTQVP